MPVTVVKTSKSAPVPSKDGPKEAPKEAERSDEFPGPAASQRPSLDMEGMEPIIVASTRELDNIFSAMQVHFEGKESEDNWTHRDSDVFTLRRVIRGNAPQDYSTNFMLALKGTLEGIFKVANSLRTTLSSNGCLLIQEVAKTCGPQIDPMVEVIMQNFLKLCGGVKKITAQNGSTTVEAIIQNATYTPRILAHVSNASQDRNPQLRLHAAGWIKAVVHKKSQQNIPVENNGGLDILDNLIKKGLGDANPGVREAMRSTFWEFWLVFPERANE